MSRQCESKEVHGREPRHCPERIAALGVYAWLEVFHAAICMYSNRHSSICLSKDPESARVLVSTDLVLLLVQVHVACYLAVQGFLFGLPFAQSNH